MLYAGDIAVLHPSPAGARTATRTISVRATASGSRAVTCRCRWDHLRDRLRAAHRAPHEVAAGRAGVGARVPGRAARARRRRRPLGPDAAADDPRGATAHHVVTEDTRTDDSRPATSPRERLRRAAPRLRAAPRRPAAAASSTCARPGGGARSRSSCRARSCARRTSTRCSASSGWCSTRCCWPASTSSSSTSCAPGRDEDFFAHLMAGIFAYYFVSGSVATASSRSSRAGA